MRSGIKWAVRIILALLSIGTFLRIADSFGRLGWFKEMLIAHPALKDFVYGPLFPVACLIVILGIIYGEKYLKLPDIQAEYQRLHLLPKLGVVPIQMLDEIMRNAGRENYEADYDVMAEVFIVNRSETEITIREFAGILFGRDKRKIPLVPTREFRGYSLRREIRTYDRGMENIQTQYVPLAHLREELYGVPLTKGHGYAGWVGFTARGLDRREAEHVKIKLWIVDAFGRKHPITGSKNHKNPEDIPQLVGP